MWALAAGGRLGIGNDPRYNKTRCFDPFPFPAASESQKSSIRVLGESLDAHRKRQQALHPKLTITDMYNVLEKLRKNEELTAKDRLDSRAGAGLGPAADPRRPRRGGRRRLRMAGGPGATKKSSAGWWP